MEGADSIGQLLDSIANGSWSFIAIGSIMNSAWITKQAVIYDSLCTAQGRRV